MRTRVVSSLFMAVVVSACIARTPATPVAVTPDRSAATLVPASQAPPPDSVASSVLPSPPTQGFEMPNFALAIDLPASWSSFADMTPERFEALRGVDEVSSFIVYDDLLRAARHLDGGDAGVSAVELASGVVLTSRYWPDFDPDADLEATLIEIYDDRLHRAVRLQDMRILGRQVPVATYEYRDALELWRPGMSALVPTGDELAVMFLASGRQLDPAVVINALGTLRATGRERRGAPFVPVEDAVIADWLEVVAEGRQVFTGDHRTLLFHGGQPDHAFFGSVTGRQTTLGVEADAFRGGVAAPFVGSAEQRSSVYAARFEGVDDLDWTPVLDAYRDDGFAPMTGCPDVLVGSVTNVGSAEALAVGTDGLIAFGIYAITEDDLADPLSELGTCSD